MNLKCKTFNLEKLCYTPQNVSNTHIGINRGCKTDVFVKSKNISNVNVPFSTVSVNTGFIQKLDKYITQTSLEDLVLFLQKEFSKKTKAIHPRYSDDIVQKTLIDVIEFFVSKPKKEDLKSFIIDIYDKKLKPTKDERLITDYEALNLDEKISHETKKTFADCISTDRVLPTISNPNANDRALSKAKLNTLISKTDLNEKEISLLNKRLGKYSDNKLKTYKELSKEENRTERVIRSHIITTMLKIQKANNLLSEDFMQFAKDFKSRFNFDIDDKEMIDFLIKNPYILQRNIDMYENKIKSLAAKFKDDGLDIKSCLVAYKKKPALFRLSPDTIENNVRITVSEFKDDGLDTKSYLEACIKQPSLFYQSPETIAEHINAYKYVEKNKPDYNGKGIMKKILNKSFTDSTSLIYIKGILLPQLKQQSTEINNFGWTNLKSNLITYFKNNPDKKFKITIQNDKMVNSFIQEINDFCSQNIGNHDMFDFAIVDMA